MTKERVEYSKIENEIENLANLANSMDSISSDITSAISSINAAWIGKAASSYTDEITKLSNNLPDAVRQLAEAIIFLASCTENYQELENTLESQLMELIGENYVKNMTEESRRLLA